MREFLCLEDHICEHFKDVKGIRTVGEVEQLGRASSGNKGSRLTRTHSPMHTLTHARPLVGSSEGLQFTPVSSGAGICACHIVVLLKIFES